MDVVVGDPGAGGEAEADVEVAFADAVDVGGGVAVNGLLVHGLPQGRASMLARSRAMRIASTLSLGWQSVVADAAVCVTPAAPPTAPVMTWL